MAMISIHEKFAILASMARRADERIMILSIHENLPILVSVARADEHMKILSMLAILVMLAAHIKT